MPLSVVQKTDVVIVTWFYPNQVGYLDFKYRVEALAKRYNCKVISNLNASRKHLGVSNDSFVHLKTSCGLIGFCNFLLKTARLVKHLSPGRIVLLHSRLAPFALILRKVKTYLYWNEHPSHLYPYREVGIARIHRNIKNHLMRWITYAGARAATTTMPIGEHHEEDLLAHGCPHEKLRLIYMGVTEDFVPTDDLRRNDCSDPGAPLKALYIGTVHRDRGRDLMIEAVSLANREKKCVHLTIVGADEIQKQACLSLSQRLGVSDSVTVVGRIPGPEIKEYLWNSDIGLCLWADKPYWRFNPPTKMFEYFVAGLAVIASDIRTHALYVKDKCNGRLCSYSAQSLARHLIKLSENREEVFRLGKSASRESVGYRWSAIQPLFLDTMGRE